MHLSIVPSNGWRYDTSYDCILLSICGKIWNFINFVSIAPGNLKAFIQFNISYNFVNVSAQFHEACN